MLHMYPLFIICLSVHRLLGQDFFTLVNGATVHMDVQVSCVMMHSSLIYAQQWHSGVTKGLFLNIKKAPY